MCCGGSGIELTQPTRRPLIPIAAKLLPSFFILPNATATGRRKDTCRGQVRHEHTENAADFFIIPLSPSSGRGPQLPGRQFRSLYQRSELRPLDRWMEIPQEISGAVEIRRVRVDPNSIWQVARTTTFFPGEEFGGHAVHNLSESASRCQAVIQVALRHQPLFTDH